MRCLLALTMCVLCASAALAPAAVADPGHYVVREGDSLGLIAKRFGCPAADLMHHNGLADGAVRVGQKIEIVQPFVQTRGADVAFHRPFKKKGRILERFGPHRQGRILVPRSGVKMACPLGATVAAPAHAIVRYVGWMDEYGTLVILEHGGGFHTVLAPLEPASVRVTVGEAVLAGEIIGTTAVLLQKYREPYLHLELRKDQKAIDPARLLK
jgi:murein DD-endopeptidase MepM/ murein hydrolase activator NlpD